MSMLHAIFLGLVQGLTEFLPVSSSGHLAITQHFLPGFNQPGVLFDVMLHVGTMVAVMLYFRRDVLGLLTSPFRSDEDSRSYRRLLWLILLASIPTAMMGLGFEDFFKSLFDNLPVVSVMLVVTGTLLFVAERLRRDGRGESDLRWHDALVAGIAQGCAIIPGISRSGSTITVLLLKGVDGETAARFSFLMALPAVFGAALLELRELQAVAVGELPAYLAGTLVAFVSGLLAIRFLLAVIRNRRLFGFALYCWIAGVVFFSLSI